MMRILVVASLLLAISPLAASLETSVASPAPHQVMALQAPAPEWWTDEVRAAAIAAGNEGKLLAPLTGETFTPKEATALVTVPYGAPDYVLIRPGALGLSEGDALCTYNFIYDAGTKIGTAGHCTAFVGEKMFILAFPRPTYPLIGLLGNVTARSNGGVGADWAISDIQTFWHDFVDPNMAYLGGPSCATWNGSGGIVKTVGHGTQTGVVAAVPRVHTASAASGGAFSGIGEVSGGDSGSPLIRVTTGTSCLGGEAAGIVTHCATITGIECLPMYWATDIRIVPATVTTGFDPL